jgi:hypothetical protein
MEQAKPLQEKSEGERYHMVPPTSKDTDTCHPPGGTVRDRDRVRDRERERQRERAAHVRRTIAMST